MRRSAALAALLALAAPASARAAWTPEAMPGTAGTVELTGFAFDATGRGLAVFEGFGARRFTGTALRDGAWTRGANLRGVGWGSARVHLYGRDRALLVTRQVTGFGRFHRARYRLVYALGRTGGPFGRYREIAHRAGPPASAANASGAAIVAFSPPRETGIWVSERRAGGAFTRPRRLGGGLDPVVAIGPRGDRLVAWYRGDRLQARVRPAGGRWGPVKTATRVDRAATESVRALVTPDGRAVLAWQTMTILEGARVRASAGVAIHRPRGRWRPALLERSRLGSKAYAGETAAIPVADTGGHVLVAWTGRWREGVGVRVARVTSTARVRDTALISAEDQSAALDDVAAGPQGRVAVSYAQLLAAGAAATWVTQRDASGAFGPPQPAGEAGLTGSRVAFSPVTGLPVVVRPLIENRRIVLAAYSSM